MCLFLMFTSNQMPMQNELPAVRTISDPPSLTPKDAAAGSPVNQVLTARTTAASKGWHTCQCPSGLRPQHLHVYMFAPHKEE